jgi:hypothetical protein
LLQKYSVATHCTAILWAKLRGGPWGYLPEAFTVYQAKNDPKSRLAIPNFVPDLAKFLKN